MPPRGAGGSEGLRYRRSGTFNLHAALERATGKIFAKPAKSKTGKDSLACMDGLLGECPEREGMEFHVIMDSCRVRKKNDAWIAAHPGAFFHYAPSLEPLSTWPRHGSA